MQSYKLHSGSHDEREKARERTLKHCKKMHSEYSKRQQYGKKFGVVLDIACNNCGIIYSTPISMLSNGNSLNFHCHNTAIDSRNALIATWEKLNTLISTFGTLLCWECKSIDHWSNPTINFKLDLPHYHLYQGKWWALVIEFWLIWLKRLPI